MSSVWDIARAVAVELGHMPVPFAESEIEAAFLHETDLDQVQRLQIVVMPAGVQISPISRAQDQDVHAVQVSLMMRVDPSDPDIVRGQMLDLARDLVRFMRDRELAQEPDAVFQDASINVLYERVMLEKNVFQAVVQLNYITVDDIED